LTARASATAGVEQNNPMRTLNKQDGSQCYQIKSKTKNRELVY